MSLFDGIKNICRAFHAVAENLLDNEDAPTGNKPKEKTSILDSIFGKPIKVIIASTGPDDEDLPVVKKSNGPAPL